MWRGTTEGTWMKQEANYYAQTLQPEIIKCPSLCCSLLPLLCTVVFHIHIVIIIFSLSNRWRLRLKQLPDEKESIVVCLFVSFPSSLIIIFLGQVIVSLSLSNLPPRYYSSICVKSFLGSFFFLHYYYYYHWCYSNVCFLFPWTLSLLLVADIIQSNTNPLLYLNPP